MVPTMLSYEPNLKSTMLFLTGITTMALLSIPLLLKHYEMIEKGVFQKKKKYIINLIIKIKAARLSMTII